MTKPTAVHRIKLRLGGFHLSMCGKTRLISSQHTPYADWVMAGQPRMSTRDDYVTCKTCLKALAATK